MPYLGNTLRDQNFKYLNMFDTNLINKQGAKSLSETQKQKARERARRYYLRHRDRLLQYNREWRAKNKEKRNETNRKYYAKNKEKVAQYHKKWYTKNRERILAQERERYAKNREKESERQKRYREQNRERIRERAKKFRMIQRFGTSGFKIYDRDKVCQKCGSEKKLVIHHINWDEDNNSLENLILLCRKCHGALHLTTTQSYLPQIPRDFIINYFNEWMEAKNRAL